jgi:LysR family transcriptional regulator, transcription activator of glutamate synthase operon
MELRHLRCLVMVADEAHFTRAAQRLRIAQPALSQQIRRLEAELGLPLVERTTRSVRMTAAGRLLVEHARRMLHEADTAVAELEDLRGLRTGRLTIGASQTMGSLDLSLLLAEFHGRYPGVELSVEEDISLALAGALGRDELDLAFLTMAGEAQGLESRPVATEALVCVLPPGHALAGRAELELGDLESESFVVFRRGATIRQRVDDAAEAGGFTPSVLFETNNVNRMGSLVAAGLGVAVLPESDAARFAPSVAVVPFAAPVLTHTVYVSWRAQRRHSPAARAFAELVFAR